MAQQPPRTFGFPSRRRRLTTCAQLGTTCRKCGESKCILGAYLPARSNTNGVAHHDTSTLRLFRPNESARCERSREGAGPPMARPTASKPSSPSSPHPVIDRRKLHAGPGGNPMSTQHGSGSLKGIRGHPDDSWLFRHQTGPISHQGCPTQAATFS